MSKLDDSLASVNEEPPLPPPPPELAVDTCGSDRSDKEGLPPAPPAGTSCTLDTPLAGVSEVSFSGVLEGGLKNVLVLVLFNSLSCVVKCWSCLVRIYYSFFFFFFFFLLDMIMILVFR